MFDDIYSPPPSASETKTERLQNSAAQRKKDTRRKTNKPVFLVSGAVLLILVIIAAFLLKINTVTVINDGFYDTSLIEQTANDGVYRHCFFPRADSLISNLETKLPYLDGVTVETDLTNQALIIHTAYTKPAFSMKYGAKYILLNRDCKILETDLDAPRRDVPVITGADLSSAERGCRAEFTEKGTEQMIADYIEIFEAAKITNMTELDLSDKRDVKVTLADGGTVLMGDYSSNCKMKTSYLADLYQRHASEETNNLYVIEVRKTSDAFIRVLDETLPEETTEEEPVTGEDGEPLTEENAGEEETTEEPTTEETTTEEPSSAEEETESPLHGLHEDITSEAPATAAPDSSAVPAEEQTSPLQGLH